MKASKEKRKRGRPATGRFSDPVSAIRLSADIKARIDKWAAKQPDNPARSEAIRRLIEYGLSHAKPHGRPSHHARAHASALASQTIDGLMDRTAPTEEQEKRKRKLIKGPLEFRDLRHVQAGEQARPVVKSKR
jgi:hypothetical protein